MSASESIVKLARVNRALFHEVMRGIADTGAIMCAIVATAAHLPESHAHLRSVSILADLVLYQQLEGEPRYEWTVTLFPHKLMIFANSGGIQPNIAAHHFEYNHALYDLLAQIITLAFPE